MAITTKKRVVVLLVTFGLYLSSHTGCGTGVPMAVCWGSHSAFRAELGIGLTSPVRDRCAITEPSTLKSILVFLKSGVNGD